MKIAVTDVETTGLDPQYNEIVEIGCIIFDSETFDICDKFAIKTIIEHPERMDPKAQACNGYNPADWSNASSLTAAMIVYARRTKGCAFASHNLTFDWGFISEAFRKTSLSNTFSRYKFDTITLAYAKIPGIISRGLSLKKVCEELGIPPEPEKHEAINGAMCAYQVFKKVMQ